MSVRNNPFNSEPKQIDKLRTPQARVLAALMPVVPKDPKIEWPLLTRAKLGVRAGYTAISGTITRALNGIREGSSSGDAHPGLLERGLVEEELVDLEGVVETNYRITIDGIRVYQEYQRVTGGKLPDLKPADLCVNDRYKEQS